MRIKCYAPHGLVIFEDDHVECEVYRNTVYINNGVGKDAVNLAIFHGTFLVLPDIE